MNGDDFIASLRNRLGNRSAADLPSATIIMEAEAIRKTQLEKAPFRPWFLMNEDTSISTVANQEWVLLPTGFLAFDPDDEWSGVAYNNPSDTGADPWVPIIVDDFNTIKDYYKDGNLTPNPTTSITLGKPVKAGIVGTKLYLRPIPNLVLNLRFRFYKSDVAMTEAPTENLWLQHAHDWLMGELGTMMAGLYTQNPDLIPLFDDLRKSGRRRVYNETIARIEANKSRQQGDE